MTAKQIAAMVKAKRKREKLSLDGLGLQLGMSAGTLSRIERAIGWPDFPTLEKLGMWLSVPVDTITRNDGRVVETDNSTCGKIDAALFADPALSLEAARKLSVMIRAAYTAGVSQ